MDKTFRIRLAFAYLVIVAFGAAVLGRSAFLMLSKNEKLHAYSERQFKQEGPPHQSRRGQILDRNKEPLAASLDVKSLYANPAKVENRQWLAQQLSGLIKMPAAQIKAKLKEKKGFVWIKRQLTDDEAASVERWLQRNRAAAYSIGTSTETKRFYPNQNLASTLLGFTNVDSRGIEGLEYMFDRELSGSGKSGGTEGSTLVLTIDKALQNIVERELEEGVATTTARSATGIILDSFTGEILAMASYPNYNPNNFKDVPAEWRRNRAITDTYEPGSTMKPILVAGAIESKTVNPATKVFCENGKFQIGKHAIREAESKDKWGWLKVEDVVAKSSNIGATKIGFLFGSERLAAWYKKMGFTAKTGVELPGEATGYMPPVENWAKINLSNISFGQGISITPLQLVQAYASFANGGRQIQPHILKEMRGYEGDLLYSSPAQKFAQLYQMQTAQQLQGILKKVPTTDGTAPKAAIPGFLIAGKTGTAQKAFPGHAYKAGKYIASFVGFAMNVNPRYVVYVMVDEPKFPYFGGEAAAPVFRKIMTAALARSGAAPDPSIEQVPAKQLPIRLGKKTPVDETKFKPVLIESDGVSMPNLLGASAKEVLDAFDKKPIAVKLQGSGIVVEQFPPPGTAFKKGDSVSIRLDRGSM